MKVQITLADEVVTVDVSADPEGGFRVAVGDGPPRRVRSGAVGAAERWIEDDAGRRTVAVHVDGERLSAQVRGHGLSGTVIDARKAALAHATGATEGTIRTPMPGAVARVLVAAGDKVVAGQVLVVVEAMKMENEFRSPIDGVVREVPVVAGTSIDGNTVLVVVDP